MKWSSAWFAWGTNCFMTPVKVTTLFWSYIANEWCVDTVVPVIATSTASDVAIAQALTECLFISPPPIDENIE
jgi:hypothetical protein